MKAFGPMGTPDSNGMGRLKCSETAVHPGYGGLDHVGGLGHDGRWATGWAWAAAG